MDITQRFGRCILGSNPGGSTETKEPALLQALSIGAGRRHVSQACETAEAGPQNFLCNGTRNICDHLFKQMLPFPTHYVRSVRAGRIGQAFRCRRRSIGRTALARGCACSRNIAPPFDSPQRARRRSSLPFFAFCVHSVRAGRIELPTRPWQGRIIPLNHARDPAHIRTLCVIHQI